MLYCFWPYLSMVKNHLKILVSRSGSSPKSHQFVLVTHTQPVHQIPLARQDLWPEREVKHKMTIHKVKTQPSLIKVQPSVLDPSRLALLLFPARASCRSLCHWLRSNWGNGRGDSAVPAMSRHHRFLSSSSGKSTCVMAGTPRAV